MKLLEKITDFFLGVEDKKETILEEPTIITNEVVKEEIQIKSLDVEKPKRRSTTTKTSEETPKKTRTRKTSTETEEKKSTQKRNKKTSEEKPTKRSTRKKKTEE